MRDGDDGQAMATRQFGQRRKHPPHVRVLVGIDLAGVSGDRIDHDQPGFRNLLEHFFEARQVLFEREVSALVSERYAFHGDDVAVIGTGFVQSRRDGVGQVVFGVEEQHAGGRVLQERQIGPRLAAGDAGGDVESDERLAKARITGQQRELAQRNAAGPEPLECFSFHGAESPRDCGRLRQLPEIARLGRCWIGRLEHVALTFRYELIRAGRH